MVTKFIDSDRKVIEDIDWEDVISPKKYIYQLFSKLNLPVPTSILEENSHYIISFASENDLSDEVEEIMTEYIPSETFTVEFDDEENIMRIQLPFYDYKSNSYIEESFDIENYDKVEEVKDEKEEEVAEVPVEAANFGIASALNSLIQDEWQTIDAYSATICTVKEMGYADMVNTLEDILQEENLHVGQLQMLLQLVQPSAEKIDDGVKEAEKQVEES